MLALVPPAELERTVRDGHLALLAQVQFKHDDAAYNLKSIVTFTLTPTPAGTRLRMEQSGFRPDQRQAFGGANAGWQQFFAKLEQVLARPQ